MDTNLEVTENKNLKVTENENLGVIENKFKDALADLTSKVFSGLIPDEDISNIKNPNLNCEQVTSNFLDKCSNVCQKMNSDQNFVNPILNNPIKLGPEELKSFENYMDRFIDLMNQKEFDPEFAKLLENYKNLTLYCIRNKIPPSEDIITEITEMLSYIINYQHHKNDPQFAEKIKDKLNGIMEKVKSKVMENIASEMQKKLNPN
jgi:hypothetical protein